MKALFCHDTYYARDENGTVYAYGAFPYSLWRDRFLPHFENIEVIGREKPYEDETAEKLDISSGPNIAHTLLPNINSPLKRILQGGKTYNRIEERVKTADAVIIRGPVEFGMLAAKAARKQGIPYAVEMSGCAFDHTWYHGSLIGKLYAPVKYLRARAMVRNADAVIYVTHHFLQKRYPTKGTASYASNVEIEPPERDTLNRRLKKIQDQRGPVIIGLIGNFGNKLKGLSVALRALHEVQEERIDFRFRVLGKGEPQKWETLIRDLGLAGKVEFSGTLPGGNPVLQWLDDLDFYIQPSFHEGLPRALIEAMSRGLPALSSDAGGSDELLEPDNIHRRGDAVSFARRLVQTLNDREWQLAQAARNFEISKEYHHDILNERRFQFWKEFKNRL